MRANQFLLPVLAACLWCGCGLLQRAECPSLGNGEKTKLIDYVQQRYGVPAGTRLAVTEESRVGSTCYRKLLFRSEDPANRFRLELFLSPDQRFLARDLLDTSAPAAAADRALAGAVLPGAAQGNFPALGKPDAPVTIAVFSDFECPYCARFATMMRKEVLPAEVQHVRFVFRQFPLPMHAWARAAAEASVCAFEQKNDYFWSFHDFFFDHQRELTPDNLRAKVLEHAGTISGLDRSKLEACLSKPETKAAIQREIAFGNDNGIRATPTVLVNGRQMQLGDSGQMLALVRQLEKYPDAPIPSSAPAATANAGPARPQAREIADVAKGDLPSLGPANAAVTLTVFSDFQCPYCARFADLMRKEVLPTEGGKIRLVFRYFPLSMHSWAHASAEAAACAYQQKNDYFWSFHDFFFEHQRDLNPANLRQQIMDHAHSVAGLDRARFQSCVDRRSTRDPVDREIAFGTANAIEGTPTVFLNGKQTGIVAREQVLTLIREFTQTAELTRARAQPLGAPQ
jgi:protein-disulfide isomerase